MIWINEAGHVWRLIPLADGGAYLDTGMRSPLGGVARALGTRRSRLWPIVATRCGCQVASPRDWV